MDHVIRDSQASAHIRCTARRKHEAHRNERCSIEILQEASAAHCACPKHVEGS
eukprot:NODE_19671_length_832_cov_11.526241.p4 GENE.NODE_19671_length_832_cov_11.526241~~NODE_19671_length_832_cov_11.526241.p4  ORF type:complete len:53 (-),score=11.36 NODE_19671_length_832_cov_11.526241:300-458(-)